MGLAKSLICSRRALDAGSVTVHGKKILEIMIGIVLEQYRKIENSSRTLEHVFAGMTAETLSTDPRKSLS